MNNNDANNRADNDAQLRKTFRALRTDDALRAPSFAHTLKENAVARSSSRSSFTPAARLLRYWPATLAGATAAALILALTLQHRPTASPEFRTAFVDSAAVSSNWALPSDSILADLSAHALPDVAERLTHEIDALLKR